MWGRRPATGQQLQPKEVNGEEKGRAGFTEGKPEVARLQLAKHTRAQVGPTWARVCSDGWVILS